MKKIIILIILRVVAGSAHADTYSNIIDSIDRPVTIALPDGFAPPQNSEQRAVRDGIISMYRNNPSMRGIYSNVYTRDWDAEFPLPYVVVGTMGSFRGRQGKITAKEWLAVRASALRKTDLEVSKERERLREMEKRGINAEFTADELTWLENDGKTDSLTVFNQMRMSFPDGGEVDLIAARKVIYKNGYVLSFVFVVDGGLPDAFSSIRNLVNSTTLVAIEGK